MFARIESALRWGGQEIQDRIDGIIYDRIVRTGDKVVARARQLAPVDTGALRESINYDVIRGDGDTFMQLVISIGVPYAIFQEFGTRNIPPHPFIRPALLEARMIWGFGLEVNFAEVAGASTSGAKWHGLHALTGRTHRARPMMVGPSKMQTLTSKQRKHVETKLIPSIKRFHRGNVKRARFKVG